MALLFNRQLLIVSTKKSVPIERHKRIFFNLGLLMIKNAVSAASWFKWYISSDITVVTI